MGRNRYLWGIMLGAGVCLPLGAYPATPPSSSSLGTYPSFADVVRVEEMTAMTTVRSPVKRCTWEQLPDQVEYNRYRQERRVTERHARRCRTIYESKAVRTVTGYNVTLRYNGETFTRQMSARPGPRLPVSVEVSAY